MLMADDQSQQDAEPSMSELQKWEAEQRRLDRKDTEEAQKAKTDFRLRERELAFKEAEARRARWWNPLAIAILGAAIAAGGSAYVSWQNSAASLQVEKFGSPAETVGGSG